MNDTHTMHPAQRWAADAQAPSVAGETRLRLSAMAGHMQVDKIAARRAALVDLLADGRPHPREEIWAAVAAQLGRDCWGRIPREALARDLRALRAGGLRIAYTRRPAVRGYYLAYPPLEQPARQEYEEMSWRLIEALRALPAVAKNARAFAMADFALRQKKLLLAEERPAWSADEIEAEARRQVYRATETSAPALDITGQ